MDSKECTRCGLSKPVSDFQKYSYRYSLKCLDCQSADKREAKRRYLAANPEKKREERKRYKAANPEKVKASHAAYRERYPEKARAKTSAWEKANPHKTREKRARRRLAERQACPAWADLDAIRSVYAEAVRLSAATGIPHEVDHIIPIRGKNICGLLWAACPLEPSRHPGAGEPREGQPPACRGGLAAPRTCGTPATGRGWCGIWVTGGCP